MLESEFNTRLHRSFSHWLKTKGVSGWWYKIPDVDVSIKPFDIIGCFGPENHRAIAIESKKNDAVHTLNIPALFKGREHQIPNLMRIQAAGGIAWVLIERKDNGRLRCHAMSPEIAQGLMLNGTCRMDELLEQKMLIECPPLPGSLFDLSPLFK